MGWFIRSEKKPRPINWKVNLAVIWFTQFLSLSAFSFCLPFLPLYLKDGGIVPSGTEAYWSGILISIPSISMMIMSPIWGQLGDKYGRKMMLVRANLAGGFVLYLMGVVDNIEALIVLRLLHGAFTGTTTAAQTLVATNTPDRSQGFAIGLIMAAISAGNTAGNYFGGICAKYFGPAFSFKLGGIILFTSTMLAVAFVRENFSAPPRGPALTRSARIRRRRAGIDNFKAGLPILFTIGLVAFLQTYDGPILSLYVEHLFRASIDPAAGLSAAAVTSESYGITGTVSAIASVAAMAGSIATGIVMDRKIPAWVWGGIVFVSGCGALWVAFDESLFGLAAGRGFFLFFVSGLAAALIVILGRMTPAAKRGSAMGWSMTARCCGWVFAPMTGAVIAQRFGWSYAYCFIGLFTMLLIPVFLYLHRRHSNAFYPEEEDPPSMGSVSDSQALTPGGQGRVG